MMMAVMEMILKILKLLVLELGLIGRCGWGERRRIRGLR